MGGWARRVFSGCRGAFFLKKNFGWGGACALAAAMPWFLAMWHRAGHGRHAIRAGLGKKIAASGLLARLLLLSDALFIFPRAYDPWLRFVRAIQHLINELPRVVPCLKNFQVPLDANTLAVLGYPIAPVRVDAVCKLFHAHAPPFLACAHGVPGAQSIPTEPKDVDSVRVFFIKCVSTVKEMDLCRCDDGIFCILDQ